MSEFIVSEETFKLRLAEKVPGPQEGECFLLYQSGAGAQNSLLINYGVKYSSAEIRHGRYNQKAIFSLEEKSFSQNYRIVMEDKDFYFEVSVKMSYGLQDVKTYFFQGKMEEEDIQHTIRNVIRQQDGKWDAWKDIELQSSLENEIERELKRYEGVRFRRLEVIVTLEEAARKMRDSNKKKTVGIHVSQNETDERIARNEQAERIADSERKLKEKQIDDMALMWRNFGNMGSIVDEYLKGNMNGKELYDYIMRARADKMSMLQTAASGDMLTQKEIMEKLNEIFTDNEFLQTTGQQQLPGGDTGKIEDRKSEDENKEDKDKKRNVEESEERADEEPPVDGEYI